MKPGVYQQCHWWIYEAGAMPAVASPTVRLTCCMITSHCYGSYQRHSLLARPWSCA